MKIQCHRWFRTDNGCLFTCRYRRDEWAATKQRLDCNCVNCPRLSTTYLWLVRPLAPSALFESHCQPKLNWTLPTPGFSVISHNSVRQMAACSTPLAFCWSLVHVTWSASIIETYTHACIQKVQMSTERWLPAQCKRQRLENLSSN